MKKKGIIITVVLLAILALGAVLLYFFLLSGGKRYTVTFISDEEQKEIKVESGNTVSKVDVNDDHFLGWYDKSTNLEFDFTTKIYKDYTLEAKYKDSYTITFDTDGGSTIDTKKVYTGDKLKEPIKPTKVAYEFVEWQYEGKKYDFNQEVTSNMKLKAIWKESEEKIKVSFDSNGGSRIGDIEVVINHPVTKPNNPTRSGYDFAGWLLNDKPYDFNEKVMKPFVLKASWKAKKKYTVTFISEGVVVHKKEVFSGEAIGSFPANPSVAGYIFQGWFNGNTQYSPNNIVNGDVGLIARFVSVDKTNINNAVNSINNSNPVIENVNTNIISQLGNTSGCSVRSINAPTSITREINNTTINVSFEVTCGGEKSTIEKVVTIKASPYYYTKTANSNMLNYNVNIEGGSWIGDAKIFIGSGGSFNVSNKFNNDNNTIYTVAFRG